MSKKTKKIIALFLAINLLCDAFFPTAALALTSGPSQPEMQSFTPVSTSDMVDIFSGDFNYNIPLLDVEGYPVNISYNAGVTMDQEASWVGLGWNINPGVINRNMRSLPDEFNGDKIVKEMNMRANQTVGVGYERSLEVFGKDIETDFGTDHQNGNLLSLNVGVKYNNYTGFATDLGANIKSKMAEPSKSKWVGSLGLSSSSQNGMGINGGVSYQKKVDKEDDGVKRTITTTSNGINLQLASGQGLQSINYSYSKSKNVYNGNGRSSTDDRGITTYGYESNPAEKSTYAGNWAYTFSNPTYTPYVGNEMTNLNISFGLSFGVEVLAATKSNKLSAYYSSQFLHGSTKDKTLKSYGYFNTDKVANKDNYETEDILLDMNREKYSAYTKHTPNLHLTNHTYDIYSVKGQGVGGTFRPHRSDIGILFDAKVKNRSEGINAGMAFHGGAGNLLKIGIDSYGLGQTNSEGGMWTGEGGDSEVNLEFKGASTSPMYEPYYFALAGEKVAESDKDYYDNVIMGSKPMHINLERRQVKNLYANNKYKVEGISGLVDIPVKNTRNTRARRNELLSALTAGEATNVGVLASIQNYKAKSNGETDISMYTNPSAYNPEYIGRNLKNGYDVTHHLSEMSVVRTDGARYIYGVPAYNFIQKEVAFAVNTMADISNANLIDYTNGLVPYDPGVDNRSGNNKQIDHFFSSTTMPPFAHSYLLNAVLSVDYVDLTGNGPSSDDLGNYTKFNYTIGKRTNGDVNFKWRLPFEANMASPNEGMLSKKGVRGDDKATYTYGEKEIWNLHSIETKNYVAVFYTSDRKDGFGVSSEDGDIDQSFALKKLDKIELYSKRELVTNNGTPIPLKTVHFVYDYSLCHGTSTKPLPNNSGVEEQNVAGQNINVLRGKLTLKEIYFTYQGSNKGKLSPYKFSYQNNYNYCSTAYDRWGSYKPNIGDLTNYRYDNENSNSITNSEDPYAVQNRALANQYSAAWSLNQIELPSGGKINVDYEADDYAFVQNKRAMQMFKIHGCYNSGQISNMSFANTAGVNLYDATTGLNDPVSNLFLAVQIDAATVSEISNGLTTLTVDQVKKAFFHNENGMFQKVKSGDGSTNIPIVYFRALIDLNRNNAIGYSTNKKCEYVSGYAELDFNESGTDANVGHKVTSDGRHFIYFKLKEAHLSDTDGNNTVNPIAMAGINYAKINFPEIAYNNTQNIDDGVSLDDFISSIVDVFKPIIDVFRGGITKSMWKTGCSASFIPQRSFVRLYTPVNKKLGGGYRIKALRLDDSWKELTADNSYQNSTYGQKYKYTTKDINGKEISSGVATYEPLIANDENPWRIPVFYSETKILAPDPDYYQEEPYGESFFPAASVGYSKITVESITSENSSITRHGTGKVVHEFYTAKDFPVKLNKTTVQKKVFHPSRFFPNPLKVISQDFLAVSQGFVIELNDMHGKQKAQYVYAQGETDDSKYISGIQHKYKRNGDKLDNEVLVINKDGIVEKNFVGLEYDMSIDMNEHRTESRSAAGQANSDNFWFGLIFGSVPTFWPEYHQENVAFKSAVVTKVINHFGLLEETVAYDLGSSVSTKSKLWDAETGGVLLTETKNNFDDNIYNFSYPAHWVYDKMGGAYKNIGFATSNPVANASAFVEGDEVLINRTGRYWVVSTSPVLKFVSNTGVVVDNSTINNAKIIRSGRRNQAGTPIAQIVSKKSPLVWNSASGKFELSIGTNTEIINASAVEFNEDWKTFCECGTKPGDTYNPYIKGIKGNWRPFKTFAFLTDRTQTKENNNTNIRKDGVYTTFVPYWVKPAGSILVWTKTNDQGWQFASEVTNYSPYGFELENKDALGRYSAAVYGYNNSLPTQVTSNSKYSQTGFDGFEDYDFNPCLDDHFGFKKPVANSSGDADVNQTGTQYQKYSHTGKKSVKVKPGKSVIIQKQIGPCSGTVTTVPSTGNGSGQGGLEGGPR